MARRRRSMIVLTIHLPRPWVEALDILVREKKAYPNRSEAIRMAVRDLLKEVEMWP